jgi:hypothetical protein
MAGDTLHRAGLQNPWYFNSPLMHLITPQDFSAFMCCEGTLPRGQWLGMKLITHIHLELKLTMCGTIPPLNYVPSWCAHVHLMFIINNTGQRSMK